MFSFLCILLLLKSLELDYSVKVSRVESNHDIKFVMQYVFHWHVTKTLRKKKEKKN